MKCIKCDRKLVSIKEDWGTRKLHKKCWKELKEEQNLIFAMYPNDDDAVIKHLELFKKKYNLTKLL